MDGLDLWSCSCFIKNVKIRFLVTIPIKIFRSSTMGTKFWSKDRLNNSATGVVIVQAGLKFFRINFLMGMLRSS